VSWLLQHGNRDCLLLQIHGLVATARRASVVSDDMYVRTYVCSIRAQVQIHGQLSITRDLLVLSVLGKHGAVSADLLCKVRYCSILLTPMQHTPFITATYSSNHCNTPLTSLQHTPWIDVGSSWCKDAAQCPSNLLLHTPAIIATYHLHHCNIPCQCRVASQGPFFLHFWIPLTSMQHISFMTATCPCHHYNIQHTPLQHSNVLLETKECTAYRFPKFGENADEIYTCKYPHLCKCTQANVHLHIHSILRRCVPQGHRYIFTKMHLYGRLRRCTPSMSKHINIFAHKYECLWQIEVLCFINVNFVLIAFITGNSSLEPLIEGLCAQIHVNLRW